MGFFDDVVYASLLFISLAFGIYLKGLSNPKQKQYVAALTGVLMVIFVCGTDFLHSLIVILINACIVKYIHPGKCQLVSFVWCFGYILFFRTTHYLGLPKVVPHANAVQLLLTLKMVGLAYEVHDTYTLRKQVEKEDVETKVKLKYEYKKIDPSFADIILYGYCYIGLLTGPYYKFRTYYDMVQQKQIDHVDTWNPLMRNLQKLPLYIFLYLLGTYFFDVKYAVTDEFYGRPFLYRFIYMTVMFTILRVRFYTAWVLSECICINAGLGAYPEISRPRCGMGPTDLEKLKESETIAPNAVVYNFETIHNIDEYGCDFTMTVREGMRHWNMSVQYWLAQHVYKRLTLKSSSAKVAITMLVSAYWHGIHMGYYLSFMTIPLCLMAEDLLIAAFHKGASPKQQYYMGWFIWFFKMRAFDYMCMGFMLLSFEDTIGYWGSIYYIVHVWTVLFIVIGMVWKPKKGSSRAKDYVVTNGANVETKKEN